MLPDSWQEIPVNINLKMCVYSRESSYFRFTLEKWSGDGNRNLAIQVYSLHNDKVCHVNTDRSQCIFCSKKIKDIKLVIFTLIVLLLTYHKNHFAKSFTFS